MKFIGALLISLSSALSIMAQPTDYIALSQQFLYAARTGDSAAKNYIDTLTAARLDELKQQLKTDDQRKAFWINLYNAYTQYHLRNTPEQYKERSTFFGARFINIGGNEISLDKVEHGILRRSKVKWSLGYLSKWFPSKFEKRFRVQKLDNRIHWALNCGAKSCPPIAFYDPAKIDKQLDLAQKAFLKSDCIYKPAENKVYVPKIFSWFRHDFGGKEGMKKILKAVGVLPAEANPTIEYLDYSWDLYLDKFKDEGE